MSTKSLKKPKLGALKKKLWSLTSEYVRRSEAIERARNTALNPDDGKCVTCGLIRHWKELQAGHFIPRAQGNALYFDLRNIHTQCYRCNINLGGNGPEYYPYMQRRYGDDVIDELRRLSKTTVKFTRSDYEQMIDEMKKKLEAL